MTQSCVIDSWNTVICIIDSCTVFLHGILARYICKVFIAVVNIVFTLVVNRLTILYTARISSGSGKRKSPTLKIITCVELYQLCEFLKKKSHPGHNYKSYKCRPVIGRTYGRTLTLFLAPPSGRTHYALRFRTSLLDRN